MYEAAGWRERNNDELHRDLLTLLGDTDHALLAQLFPPVAESHAAGSFETGTVKTPTICQVSPPPPSTCTHSAHMLRTTA